ncbi:hypothetical protein RCL1_006507 [Eukaryota sp. TZLM3-RCL]
MESNARINTLQADLIKQKHLVSALKNLCSSNGIKVPSNLIDSSTLSSAVLSLSHVYSQLEQDFSSLKSYFQTELLDFSSFYNSQSASILDSVTFLSANQSASFSSLQNDKQQLSRQLSRTNQELTTLRQENTVAQDNLIGLQKSLSLKEAKIVELEALLRDSNIKLNKLPTQTPVIDHSPRIAELEKEISSLKIRNKSMSSELSQKEAQLLSAVTESELLAADLSKVEMDMGSVREEVSKLNIEKDNLNRTITNLKESLSVLASQKDNEWMEKLTKLKSDFMEESGHTAGKIKKQIESTYKKEVDELRGRLAFLTDELNKGHQLEASLRDEVTRLSKQNERLASELKSLEQEMTSLKPNTSSPSVVPSQELLLQVSQLENSLTTVLNALKKKEDEIAVLKRTIQSEVSERMALKQRLSKYTR